GFNTYEGGTAVNDGTLEISGYTIANNYVNGFGQLVISGTTTGSVDVDDFGSLDAVGNGWVDNDIFGYDYSDIFVGFNAYVSGDVILNDSSDATIIGDIGGDLIHNSDAWSYIGYPGDVYGDIIVTNGIVTLNGEAWQDVIVTETGGFNGN